MSLGNVGGDTPHSFLPPTQQSAKRSSYETWTTEDNILLLTGYFHVSNDSELGNNQNGETFWGKITQYVNENAKSGKERIVSRCHSHFKDINRKISSFIGCYSAACREKRSGWSDENYISKARELYFEKMEGRDVAKKKARASSSKTSVSRKSKGAIEEELSKLVSAHEKFEEKRSSTASAMNNLAHSKNMEMWLFLKNKPDRDDEDEEAYNMLRKNLFGK
ncbi:glutathione S-transferase T2-like [Asparagus officinalis]|uniref:glutathione S-transferase T2-like n=1 Tax=Asparagus officinalis TaxID=4686 RepID=UPI00098E014E|nr:glutathione S-transferase T2-like [Asparagus officinalis]